MLPVTPSTFIGTVFAGPTDGPAIDALVKNALISWEVPGCAVAIVYQGQVVYLKGHGVKSIDKNEPVTVDTLFPLASCTKAFTATLIGQLVDEGKMSWDDPVRKYLPWFKLNDASANADVTIRDLLSHRTGLGSHDYLWYRSPLPMADVVRRAAFLPLTKPFRSEFQYQSVLVTAAGLAAAQAGGEPWDQLMRKRLLNPLGMKSTTCVSPDTGDRASPHRLDAAGRLVVVPWYQQREPNPAGSIHAPIRDLAQWLLFQLGDGTFDGKRLISAQRLGDTHSPQIGQRLEGATAAMNAETTKMDYGLGWVIQDYRGQLLWSHTGVIDGFRAQIALAPKSGIGIAVLSNRHETRMNLALIDSLLDRMLNTPRRDWNGYLQQVIGHEEDQARRQRQKRDRLRDSRSPSLTEYAGRYQNDAYGVVELKMDGDRLKFLWNSFTGPMRFHHAHTLELENLDLNTPLIEFEMEGGRPKSFRLFDVVFRRE